VVVRKDVRVTGKSGEGGGENQGRRKRAGGGETSQRTVLLIGTSYWDERLVVSVRETTPIQLPNGKARGLTLRDALRGTCRRTENFRRNVLLHLKWTRNRKGPLDRRRGGLEKGKLGNLILYKVTTFLMDKRGNLLKEREKITPGLSQKKVNREDIGVI